MEKDLVGRQIDEILIQKGFGGEPDRYNPNERMLDLQATLIFSGAAIGVVVAYLLGMGTFIPPLSVVSGGFVGLSFAWVAEKLSSGS